MFQEEKEDCTHYGFEPRVFAGRFCGVRVIFEYAEHEEFNSFLITDGYAFKEQILKVIEDYRATGCVQALLCDIYTVAVANGEFTIFNSACADESTSSMPLDMFEEMYGKWFKIREIMQNTFGGHTVVPTGTVYRRLREAVLKDAKEPSVVSMPVIHKYLGRYCLAVFAYPANDIPKSVDECRPSIWAIADIQSGSIIAKYVAILSTFQCLNPTKTMTFQ